MKKYPAIHLIVLFLSAITSVSSSAAMGKKYAYYNYTMAVDGILDYEFKKAKVKELERLDTFDLAAAEAAYLVDSTDLAETESGLSPFMLTMREKSLEEQKYYISLAKSGEQPDFTGLEGFIKYMIDQSLNAAVRNVSGSSHVAFVNDDKHQYGMLPAEAINLTGTVRAELIQLRKMETGYSFENIE